MKINSQKWDTKKIQKKHTKPTKPTKPKVIECQCNPCRWRNALQMKKAQEFDYNGI